MSAKRATILCFSQRGPGTSERTAKKKGWGRRETKKGRKNATEGEIRPET